MSAVVVPFPIVRRRSFVRKHAARMASLPETTGEKHLAYQLRLQTETMLKRGIAPDIVEQEVRSLETAIRCELGRLVLTPEAG